MEANYKIELVRNHDIPEITKLVNAAYKELADMGLNYTATYQNDDKTKERISKGRCFILKDSSGRILGTILMTVENYFTNRNTAYLGQFGILPEFKKNGLGTKLIEFCENLALEEGFAGIQLDTAIPANHLVEWYQRRGYKIVGQEHYDGKTYDSFVFEKTFPSQWERYFLKNVDRKIRPFFEKAISFATNSKENKTALDIGSGIGIETIALLDKGYRVTAVDNQVASQLHIENKLSEVTKSNFKFILSNFSDFHFDQEYDFVWAYHSLPFCNEKSFLNVVQDSVKSVKKDGLFSGSFFGEQDEWSISKRAQGLSKKQLVEIFSGFEILEINETLKKDKVALGGEKFWHIFDIIARKR